MQRTFLFSFLSSGFTMGGVHYKILFGSRFCCLIAFATSVVMDGFLVPLIGLLVDLGAVGDGFDVCAVSGDKCLNHLSARGWWWAFQVSGINMAWFLSC